jgi:hypothetical protein
MKAVAAAALFVGVLHGTPTLAKSAAASPLLGSWAVDVSRLPIPPEARPKSVTITFSDAGADKWKINVDILGGDGSERHMTSTYTPDGTPSSIEGDTAEADIAAVKIPTPNVMVLELGKGGMPASTRVYTVAADGKTMIETAASTGAGGKPSLRTNYFSRMR